jgi:anaerobic magnesium-protoporphyrin IX monomethyl ester cyclase
MAKLLFLQNIEYEFLGPMYISAYAGAGGHRVRMAMGNDADSFENSIQEFQPDLIGFSTMTGSHLWARDMARELKARHGLVNIFGGAHPTFSPDFIHEQGVDMLVRGEGEEAVREILDRIDSGSDFSNVPNLIVKLKNGGVRENPVRKLRSDLDDYPFPDRNLYDALEGQIDRSVRTVITSRGCPFHCTFCFEDSLRELYKGKGKFVRIRSISKVIEELKVLCSTTNVETIYFTDDLFGVNRKWLYQFLKIYKREVGVPFICLARADLVAADPAYSQQLADGGCRTVFFGIESGNEGIRNLVLKKRLSNAQILLAAEHLHKAGIRFRTYNIVGLPDETLEDAFATLRLNIAIHTDYPWCSVFMPFPGTALNDYAAERGYLDRAFTFDSLSESFFSDSRLNIPDIDRMTNLQKFFQTAVLWPWTVPLIRRLINLRPNRLFDAWFGLVYFLVYIRSENKSFWKTMRFAMRNYRHVITRKL